MGSVAVGVDIGQKVDPTAIAVVETEERSQPAALQIGWQFSERLWGGRRPAPPAELHYRVRTLERLPLGTSYPKVALRVAAVVAGVMQKTGALPELFVDATGVGLPVVDMIRAAAPHARPVDCYFTHGDRRTEREDGSIMLGKAYLVSRLQALLQSARLHLPKTSEAEALAQELRTYEIRVDEDANDRYGAFKVGAHDDLVTALGLAVQVDRIPLLAW